MRIHNSIPADTNRGTTDTSDFGVACYLFACGISLAHIEKDSASRKATFIFSNTQSIHKLIEDFWSDKAKISPLKLLNAQRELKRRLYSDTYSLAHEEKK